MVINVDVSSAGAVYGRANIQFEILRGDRPRPTEECAIKGQSAGYVLPKEDVPSLR
jgi:hypothetical protein